MDRDALAIALAFRLDVPVHSVRVFLHAYFDAVKTVLRSGEAVDLGGLGMWEAVPSGSDAGTVIQYFQPLPAPVISGDRHVETSFIIPHDELHPETLSARCIVDVAGILAEVVPAAASHGASILRVDTDDADTVFPTIAQAAHPAVLYDAPDDLALVRDFDDAPVTDPPPTIAEHDEAVVGNDIAFGEAGMDDTFQDVADEYIAILDEAYPDAAEALPVDEEADNLPPEHDVVAEGEHNDSVDAYHPNLANNATVEPAPENAVANRAEREDFSDEDSFYRNRDQLYNPPEKKSSKLLILVAVLLTAAVLAIILYLVFTEEPVRELPGVDAPAISLHHVRGPNIT